MDKSKFIGLLAETIQAETPLTEGTVLAGLEEWDSLALMTTVGLFKRSFQINLTLNDINGCRTVADLIGKTQGKVAP